MANQSKEQNNLVQLPTDLQVWTTQQFVAIEMKVLPEELAKQFFEFLEPNLNNPELASCFADAMKIAQKMRRDGYM